MQQLQWQLGRPPALPFPCIGGSSWRRGTDSWGNTRSRVRVWVLSSSSPTQVVEAQILPNALRRKSDRLWGGGGFSLGVDLGNSRTGLALGKGYAPRPLTVLEMRGKKLELRLLEIAEQQEVDEFIIGLPKSHDGKETPQSNKVRSIAGRFAVRAAER